MVHPDRAYSATFVSIAESAVAPYVEPRVARLVDLEKAFWVCDYAATTRRVDLDEGALCAVATDELKQ